MKSKKVTINDYPAIHTEYEGRHTIVYDGGLGGAVISGDTYSEAERNFIEAMRLAKCVNVLLKIEDKAIKEILIKLPDHVIRYKNGEKGLLGLFVGEAMKSTRGVADPKYLVEKIKHELEK